MKLKLPTLLGILLLASILFLLIRVRPFETRTVEQSHSSISKADIEFSEMQKSIYNITLNCDSGEASKILKTSNKFRETLLRSLLEGAIKNDCDSIVADVLRAEKLQDPVQGKSLISFAIESKASEKVVRLLADAGYRIPPDSDLLTRFPSRETLKLTISRGMVNETQVGIAFSRLPEEVRGEWSNVIAQFGEPIRSQIATKCLELFPSSVTTPSVEPLLPFANSLVLKIRLSQAISNRNAVECKKYIDIPGVVDQLSLDERFSLHKLMPGASIPRSPDLEERLMPELWKAAVGQFPKDHSFEPLKALIQKRPDIVNLAINRTETAADIFLVNKDFYAVSWLQKNGAKLSRKIEFSEEFAFFKAVLSQNQELLIEAALDSGSQIQSFASQVTSWPLAGDAGTTPDAVPMVRCSAIEYTLKYGSFPFASLLARKCPTATIDGARLLADPIIRTNRDMVSLVLVLAMNRSSSGPDGNSVTPLEGLYPDGFDLKAIQDDELQLALFDKDVQKYLFKAVEANNEALLALVFRRMKIHFVADQIARRGHPASNSLLDAQREADSLLELSIKKPRILNRLIAEGFRPSIVAVRSACEGGNVEALQAVLQSTSTLLSQESIYNLIKTFEDSPEISGTLKMFVKQTKQDKSTE